MIISIIAVIILGYLLLNILIELGLPIQDLLSEIGYFFGNFAESEKTSTFIIILVAGVVCYFLYFKKDN